ncbi:DUF2871 domain-containing protein [Tessaracoccus sp. Z1128]
MLNRLFTSAAAWTALGMGSGLYWREMTRFTDFTGDTQLSTAHTHALALGTLMLLVILALARAFSLPEKPTMLATLLWNVGLGLTFGAMVVKGTLQVLEIPIATSPMWAGIGGLGHMVITGTFVYLFVILRRALVAAPVPATVGA